MSIIKIVAALRNKMELDIENVAISKAQVLRRDTEL